MKFILDENLSLEEKLLLEKPGDSGWTAEDNRIYYGLVKSGDVSEADADKIVKNAKEKAVKGKDKADLEYLKSRYDRDYQKNKAGAEQQSEPEETEDPQPEETEPVDEPSEKANNSDYEIITGNETADRLLSIIKSSNGLGYKTFINGIKSNIKNKDFPFTQLMMNPAFSSALLNGLKTESLDEASVLGNIKNKIANSTVGQAVSNAKNTFKNSDFGKKVTSTVAGINPNTYRKFATVYNTFLDKDALIKGINYVNDKSAIVYNPNLYKINNTDALKHALEVDLSAAAYINRPEGKQKREEIQSALTQGEKEVNKVSAFKTDNLESKLGKQAKVSRDTTVEDLAKFMRGKTSQEKEEFLQQFGELIGYSISKK